MFAVKAMMSLSGDFIAQPLGKPSFHEGLFSHQ